MFLLLPPSFPGSEGNTVRTSYAVYGIAIWICLVLFFSTFTVRARVRVFIEGEGSPKAGGAKVRASHRGDCVRCLHLSLLPLPQQRREITATQRSMKRWFWIICFLHVKEAKVETQHSGGKWSRRGQENKKRSRGWKTQDGNKEGVELINHAGGGTNWEGKNLRGKSENEGQDMSTSFYK